MRFAFATDSAPDWDLQTLAARAKDYGFDGLEFAGVDLLADVPHALAVLTEFGIAVACISTAATFRADRDEDARDAERLRYAAIVARDVGCRFVRMQDPPTPKAARSDAFVAWLRDLAAHMGSRNVTLVIENNSSLRTAREMWTLLDRVASHSVAACWNPAHTDERPGVSVPVLNSQIRFAALPAAGDDAAKVFLTRLRGIGYTGWVSVRDGQDDFVGAAARLNSWGRPSAPPAPKQQQGGRPAPAAVPPPAR
jgi:sugar phosphate isomerase/epimerase